MRPRSLGFGFTKIRLALRDNGNSLAAAEVQKAAAPPAVMTGVMVYAGDSCTSHAGVFIARDMK